MSRTHPLLAGFAQAEMTPPHPEGMHLSSMGRLYPGARGVRDPLTARAVYLECGDRKWLMLTCDNVNSKVTRPYHDAVLADLARYGGMPIRDVWLVSTHCHSSTGEEGGGNPYMKKRHNRYVLGLLETLRRIGREAIDGKTRVQMGCGAGPVEKVGTNRRVKLSDGTVVTGWGAGPCPTPETRLVGRGPHDPNIGVAFFKGLDGRPKGAVVTYNSHIHLYPTLKFSSELAGGVCRALESRFPGLTAVYAVGAEGDVALSENLVPQSTAPTDWDAQFDRELARTSGILVRRLERLYHTVPYASRARMECGDAVVRIPNSKQKLTRERLSAVAVNEWALIGQGEEMFVEFALRLKERSPFASTFVVGMKDPHNFYFPTTLGMEEGGYESKDWFKPGSMDQVIEASTRLLRKLRRRMKSSAA